MHKAQFADPDRFRSTLRVVQPDPSDRASIQIYRPFFIAGIATLLTVGCLLGAVALMGIATKGAYTQSTWTPYILAHANSQLFGWVGFFVMGFLLQQHGTQISKSTKYHQLAYVALALMGGGIVVRFVAEPLAQVDFASWSWLGVLASTLQICAVLVFLYNYKVNRHCATEFGSWPAAIVGCALFSLLVISLIEPWVFLYSHQPNRELALTFVAGWLTPLREFQFLGFVSLMIFGVSCTKLSGCLGFQSPKVRWTIAGFWLWIFGLLCRIVGWRMYHSAELAIGSDIVFRVGAVALLIGALCFFESFRILEASVEKNPSQKFIRTAYGWLIIACLLSVFEPLHLKYIGAPFSHAYPGAIRHALTVGFISQMIIGVGYFVVTQFRLQQTQPIPTLWPAFILLNIGNTGRIGFEIATDYSPNAFAPMGFTGVIELLGVSFWAWAMLRYLVRSEARIAVTH